MDNISLMQCKAMLARQQTLHQQNQKRVARRIHDDISQHLTLLALQLSLAASDTKPPANWEQSCRQWSTLVLELGQNLRSIINELQPRIHDEYGLGAALQWYAHSCPAGVECQLVLPGEPVALPTGVANEVFAICREIVSDVFAPYGITEVTIALQQSQGLLSVHLRTKERNESFEPLVAKGLETLAVPDRLICVDGSVEVQQDSDKGLAVTLSLPAGREAASRAA